MKKKLSLFLIALILFTSVISPMDFSATMSEKSFYDYVEKGLSLSIEMTFNALNNTAVNPPKTLKVNYSTYCEYNVIAYGAPHGDKKYSKTTSQEEYRYLGYDVSGMSITNQRFPNDADDPNTDANDWNFINLGSEASSSWENINIFGSYYDYARNALLSGHGASNLTPAKIGTTAYTKLMTPIGLFSKGTFFTKHKNRNGKVWYATFESEPVNTQLDGAIYTSANTYYLTPGRKSVDVPVVVKGTVITANFIQDGQIKNLKTRFEGVTKQNALTKTIESSYTKTLRRSDYGPGTYQIKLSGNVEMTSFKDEKASISPEKTIQLVVTDAPVYVDATSVANPESIKFTGNDIPVRVTVSGVLKGLTDQSLVDRWEFYSMPIDAGTATKKTVFGSTLNQSSPFDFTISKSKLSSGNYTQDFKSTARVFLKDGRYFDAPTMCSTYVYKDKPPATSKPFAIIEAPSEVTAGNEFTFDGRKSYSEGSTIVAYSWDMTPSWYESIDPPKDSQGKARYDSWGEQRIRLTVTDANGATDTTEKIITVLPPKPIANLQITGCQKQNRQVGLDLSTSYTPERFPMVWSKSRMTITPMTDGVEATDFKYRGTLNGVRSNENCLAKKPGDYKVSVHLENAAGFTDDRDFIVTIEPDKPFIMDFNTITTIYRDPQSGGMANIDVLFWDTPVDGDPLATKTLKYAFDKDNDGNYAEEKWESVDVLGKEKVTIPKNDGVGRVRFELVGQEAFGQPTLEEFVTADDRLKSDTAAKPYADKTVTVDNIPPLGDFRIGPQQDIDMLIVLDNTTVTEADAEAYFNLQIKPRFDGSKYVHRHTILKNNLTDALREYVFKANSKRYVMYFHNGTISELSDPLKWGNLVSLLTSNDVELFTIGSTTYQGVMERLITQNNGSGKFYPNTNIQGAFTDIADYITDRAIVDIFFNYGISSYQDLNTVKSRYNAIVLPKLNNAKVEAKVQWNEGFLKNYWATTDGQGMSTLFSTSKPLMYVAGGMYQYNLGGWSWSNGLGVNTFVGSWGSSYINGKPTQVVKGHSGHYITFWGSMQPNGTMDIYSMGATVGGEPGQGTWRARSKDDDPWSFMGKVGNFPAGSKVYMRQTNSFDYGGSWIITPDGRLFETGRSGTFYHRDVPGSCYFQEANTNGKKVAAIVATAWSQYTGWSSGMGAIVTQDGKLYHTNGTVYNLYSGGVKDAVNLARYTDRFIVLTPDGKLVERHIFTGYTNVLFTDVKDICFVAGGDYILVLRNGGELHQISGGALSGAILNNVVSMSTDGSTSHAVRSDGTVYGWGNNWTGQVGDGTYINKSYPVLISSAPKALDIQGSKIVDELKKADTRLHASKYFVNLADGNLTDLEGTDGTATAEKLNKEKMYYVGLAKPGDKAQVDGFLSSKTVNGTYVDNTNLDAALNNLADYIIKTASKDSDRVEYTVLQNENVDYTAFTDDYEGDPVVENSWVFKHVNPNYFENANGTNPKSGQVLSEPITKFNEVGLYEGMFKGRDMPNTDPAFAEFSKWSLDNPYKIKVHRRPIAEFDADVQSNGNVTLSDRSYDLDHESEAQKGIVYWKWMYKEATADDWIEGQVPSPIDPSKRYVQQLIVQDKEGAWSLPYTQLIAYIPLDIKLTLNPSTLPASESTLATVIINTFLDINKVTGWLDGEKSVTMTKTGPNTWTTDYQVPATKKDQKWKFYAKANIGNAIFEWLDVVTPINLVPDLPSEADIGQSIDVNASTSKYADAVKVKAFKGTAYETPLTLTGTPSGIKKNWTGQLVIPEIPAGNYTFEFTATTPNGNTEVKSLVLTIKDIAMANFRVNMILDKGLEPFYLNSGGSPKYVDRPLGVNEMAISDSNFVHAGIPIVSGFDSLKKGYFFKFAIDTKGLNGASDTVQIKPRFFAYYPGSPGVRSSECDLYWVDSDNKVWKAGEGAHSAWDYLVLSSSNRTIKSSSDATWSSKYLIPGTSFLVPKGTSLEDAENMLKNKTYTKGNIIVNFYIVGYKNGVAKFDYNSQAWPKERTVSKWPFSIGDVIVYDYKLSNLDDIIANRVK